MLMLVSIVGAVPLLSGCLERSTTVGDRYSGSVIVATSPDNPSGVPKPDVPESMASRISLSEYHYDPAAESASPSASATPGQPDRSGAASSTPGNGAPSTATSGGAAAARVGTRAVFSDLTAGQFNQLGTIVAESFGESAMSMDLASARSGGVVRFRGSADLSGLTERDYVQFTVTFDGPVTATSGEQIGENTVRWTPEPRKPADFTADATYPDPATAAVSSWSWFLALVCVVTVLAVGLLAWAARDRGPRPGRPRPSRDTTAGRDDAPTSGNPTTGAGTPH
ncbi:DUF3153 domain-containing protein [Gordonia sp. CPCC 206044]|uniref:LppM family (lipo)protein n=1 Tax=Gordonia sp. CPCC 206044 TaxID=3140793 RepID=UPI003AF36027